MAKAAGARSEWERRTLEMIAEVEAGEAPIDVLVSEVTPYDDLYWIMSRAKEKRPMSPNIERHIDALSREFYRRRK